MRYTIHKKHTGSNVEEVSRLVIHADTVEEVKKIAKDNGLEVLEVNETLNILTIKA